MILHRASLRSLAQHVGPIIVGKVIQYVGSLLFAILVPRLMGPTNYGSFAVYASLLILLSMLGDFGTLPIFGRFVPFFQATGKEFKVGWLFSRLLVFKTLVAAVMGLLFLPIGRLAFSDWPWLWLLLGGSSLLLRIAADNFYHLAFGLNHMAQWIARESLRSVVQFALVLPLFYLCGLSGAVIGLFLADLSFLILGWRWARHYWTREGWRIDSLWPYLGYGVSFFGANACLMTFQRSGDVLLALQHVNPAEIAFFDLAFSVFLFLYGAMTQLSFSAVPTLVGWQEANRKEAVHAALNLMWKASAGVAMIPVALTWLFADWLVPFVFGPAYAPAAAYLKVVILSLVPLALGQMGYVVASVYKRPAIPLWASLVTLIVFVPLTLALVPACGAMGPTLASVVAMTTFALVSYRLSYPCLRLHSWRSEIEFVRTWFHVSH